MKRLDEIEARANAATEGPWKLGHFGPDDPEVNAILSSGGTFVVSTDGDSPIRQPNAEFISRARQDAPALVAALRAVLEMHAETPYGCAVCEEQNWALPWPCPTVAAIHQHLGEDA